MSKKRKIKVAVVSIPLVSGFAYFVRKKIWPRSEIFEPGMLDERRRELVEHIQKDEDVEVIDYGDLIYEELPETKKKGRYIDANVVRELGKRIEKLRKKHDLVVIIGSTHTGASFMYTGPWEVARFDAHPDRGKVKTDEFYLKNYVSRIIQEGIKSSDKIHDYGIGGKRIPDSIADAHVFDIDLDVFDPWKYRIQSKWWAGRADPEDVIKHIRSSEKIHTIGFFEYYPRDDQGKGIEAIKSMTMEAIGAVKRRKRKERRFLLKRK
ncbi:MAG: hypothetical protein J7K68_02275 [Candidatus Diapherotrites archaeon]|nr:hypothetical protein [Candidatus Diapherotrites archaeon]